MAKTGFEGIGLMRSNRVRARTIPKGLRPTAQGCEERATLGKRRSKSTTATRLRPCLAGHVQGLRRSGGGWRADSDLGLAFGRGQVRGRERTGRNRVAVGEVS